MKKYIGQISLWGLIWFISLGCSNQTNLEIQTHHFLISFSNNGNIKSFVNKGSEINYLSGSIPSPLLKLRNDNEEFAPINMSHQNDTIYLTYNDTLSAKITWVSTSDYLKFQIVEVSATVDLAIWGPFQTTIGETIGETVGVVRNQDFAIGIQALNPKTLGGYPWNDNDAMPQLDIFEQDDPTDLSEKGKRGVLYRVEAAKPTEKGSSLQAYTRERFRDRIVENLRHQRYVSPKYDDGGVVGSKIALFGTTPDKVLEIIEKIELGEGLPHPRINGEWSKTAKVASSAYIIMEFGEETIEEAIEITKKAGLNYLYHSHPFKTWGHYNLRKDQFPNGSKGLKEVVKKAKEEEIHIGVHTLSNFINPTDPYVSPNPDPRLAKVGNSHLLADIDEMTREVPIDAPDFFNQYENNHLKTVMIDNELIRYEKVSETEPWILLNCERGAYGTTPASHEKGSPISKLADHGYKVFLSDADLGMEISGNLARLFNDVGLRQISFDGVEGNRSTGMGNYGEILFTTHWYNNLDEEIKNHFIADASRTTHYFWHIYTRMNWGEPWYAGFRESQTGYRLKNQAYFKRNYMPGMLGWFKLDEMTTLEDVEWMLARSTGFDAGYGFVLSFDNVEKNKISDKILKTLGYWEEARMNSLFSKELKEEMKDVSNEYHLKKNPNGFVLYPVDSYKFNHEKKIRQPGEPLYSTFEFENTFQEQPFSFILYAAEGDISNPTFELDDFKSLDIDISLEEGQSLRYNGNNMAYITDSNQAILDSINIDPQNFMIEPGKHKINFDTGFVDSDTGLAKLEVRIIGEKKTLSPLPNH